MQHIDTILSLGTEVNMLEQDGSFAIIRLPEPDIYPFIAVQVIVNDGLTKYKVIHAPRRDLEDIDEAITNDLIYYLYKHYVSRLLLDLDGCYNITYIEEDKLPTYLRQLYKLDRRIIEKIKREVDQTIYHTVQMKNTTLVP